MNLNIPQTGKNRIVVIGGGFAGVTLVKKLAKQDVQVVLLDRRNYHLFQPLLYQVATADLSPGDISFPLRKLFHKKKNVHFRMTSVISVDADSRIVRTAHGSIRYDRLVLATGSEPNFFGMENIIAEAMPMKEAQDALRIRNHVLTNMERAVIEDDRDVKRALLNIVIVGGGPTGVELAGAFAEMKRNNVPGDYPEVKAGELAIYLIEGSPKLIPTMSEKTSEGTLRQLRKMGVEVITGVVVTDYKDGKAVLKDGRTIPTYNLIWTSGVKVVIPEGLDKATRAKSGRVLTDMNLLVDGYEDIYAIGDASYQVTEKFPNGYPQLAREGMEQATALAANFKRTARGESPEPYKRVEYPIMATVGNNHAYAEYKKIWLKGFVGWITWAGVHLVSIFGARNKGSVFFGWAWNYITADRPTRIILNYSAPDREQVEFAGEEQRISDGKQQERVSAGKQQESKKTS